MNINAQELSIMRKNMKFGEAQPTVTTAPVAEPPVAKPESGLNALEMQAKNNIAFQGLGNSTLLNKLRQKTATYYLTAFLTAATPIIATSCIDNSAIAEVDMSMLITYLQQIIDNQNKQFEEQKLTREAIEEGNRIQKENQLILQNMYETNQLTFEEVKNLSSILSTGITNITSYLKAHGATDAQILAALKAFDAKVDANMQKLLTGQISIEEYIQALQKAVEDAKNILNDILAEVKGLRDDIANNHKEYKAAIEEAFKMLGNISENGKINNEKVDELNKNTQDIKAYLANLEQNTKDLINIITDPERYDKFMEDLGALMPEDVDYAKFEAMFAAYGLKMEDVINMSSEKLVKLLNDFMTNERANDAKLNELLDSINSKLDILKNFPDFNLGDLQASVDAFKEAMQADNKDIMALIKDVIMKMDIIIGKIDTVVENTDVIVKNMNNQQAKWDEAMKLLGENNELLKAFKAGQTITNENLEKFGKNFENIEKNQKTQISYLNILNGNVEDIEEAIKNLELTVNVEGGMTVDEFVAAMEKRDAAQAEAFKKFVKDYGFDTVPSNVQTIKDLLGEVKDAVKDKTDYSGQLGKIIGWEEKIYNLITNKNCEHPDIQAQLNEVIEAIEKLLKNEGIEGELGDLEDMFSQVITPLDGMQIGILKYMA